MRSWSPAGSGSCHGGAACGSEILEGPWRPPEPSADRQPIRTALVGHPNAGKSALFGQLTGRYVTVSNYPGTSVEVIRGRGRPGSLLAEVVDTPGAYGLLTTSEDERVTRRLLLEGGADVVVHVADAKSLERALPLTLQLLELGLPVVLALNMMDEARDLEIRIDAEALSERLGIPVVPLVAVDGAGIDELEGAVVRAAGRERPGSAPLDDDLEAALSAVGNRLDPEDPGGTRLLAELLLTGDDEAMEEVSTAHADGGRSAVEEARRRRGEFSTPPAYLMAVERRRRSEELLDGVVESSDAGERRLRDRLGRLLTRPVTGLPILALVLYLGLYQFVGVFGAGTVVDWLEGTLFEGLIEPWLAGVFALVPWTWLQDLFVGEYGLVPLGLRYAVAIVLPIVGAFFLFFSVLEDSGYFPRLALLVDRAFKKIGLSGRAVIPIVLGFACDTMATMVTRTLETRRERVLATVLLALAIPCSAQLGVILAVLAGQPVPMMVWTASVLGTFLVVGAVGARLLPGRPARFHMEIPPLRRPRVGNVLRKTAARVQWYFMEVLPLFLAASVLLWAGDLTGVLARVKAGLEPVVQALGLPAEAASVLLFGFFRRDYGAAGLFDLHRAGALDPVQLAVAAVTLTLFVPCIAQFLMMIRERGARMAAGVMLFATTVALGAGWMVHAVLRGVGL